MYQIIKLIRILTMLISTEITDFIFAIISVPLLDLTVVSFLVNRFHKVATMVVLSHHKQSHSFLSVSYSPSNRKFFSSNKSSLAFDLLCRPKFGREKRLNLLYTDAILFFLQYCYSCNIDLPAILLFL